MNIAIAGRLIKGLGAGGLYVLQTMILCERPRWLEVMSMAASVGAVTGPFLGGVFAETGWQWLGWINLITVAITGALSFFFFLNLTPIEGDMKQNMKRLDCGDLPSSQSSALRWRCR